MRSGGVHVSDGRPMRTMFVVAYTPMADLCLVGNEGMDPKESLLGAHSLIP